MIMADYKYESEMLEQLKLSKKASLDQIAAALKLDKNALMRPLTSLEEKGLVKKSVESTSSVSLSEEGKKYLVEGLPEIRVYEKARAGKSVADLAQDERQFGIKWAKEKGLAAVEAGKLRPLKSLSEKEVSAYSESYLTSPSNVKELVARGLATESVRKEITLEITGEGIGARLGGGEGLTQLTSDMLRTGAWKNAKFKEYDVTVPAKNAQMGKVHPITHAMERIRRIFSEMGFEEMEGGYVESAFWNFDALFQPQDHPARELADTFYLEKEEPLPEKKLVERVKQAHEKGWGYAWSEQEAKRRVLRTHTTALSARHLSKMDKTPKKYFAVGRVFRNEATDFKHLAEFHQVEGILAWEDATFRDLLGMLRQFYSKLGFRKIRFRPSYFPYTEPSLEIEVYFEERKQWIELGGAGIMRPEVSYPLANTYPVLAWGLSLERPLMMLMGLSDIRTFYKNDLGWLKKAKVKI